MPPAMVNPSDSPAAPRATSKRLLVSQARPVARRAAPESPAWTAPPSGAAGPGARDPAPHPRARTRPGITAFGLTGVAVTAACVLGMVLNFTLDWAEFEGDKLDRDGYADAGIDHFERLALWPLLAYIFGIVLGVGLLVVDLVPNIDLVQRILRAVLLTGVAYFGFLLTLTGTRFAGMYVAVLMSEDSNLTLLAVPYINLALGLAFLVASAWLLRRLLAPWLERPGRGRFGRDGVRIPLLTLLVAGGALLVSPLLPYAVDEFAGVKTYYSEAGIVAIGENPFGSGENEDPATDLGVARAMAWIVLYVSILCLAFGLAERTGSLPNLWGALLQLYALNAVALVVGSIFVAFLYFDIPDMPGLFGEVSLAYNYFLPMAYLVLLGLFALYVLRIGGPFAARLRQQAANAGPEAWTPPPGEGRGL